MSVWWTIRRQNFHDFILHRIPPVASISPMQWLIRCIPVRAFRRPLKQLLGILVPSLLAIGPSPVPQTLFQRSLSPVSAPLPSELSFPARSSQSRRWDRFEAPQPPNVHSVCSHSFFHPRQQTHNQWPVILEFRISHRKYVVHPTATHSVISC
jgi:hypothetical protein